MASVSSFHVRSFSGMVCVLEKWKVALLCLAWLRLSIDEKKISSPQWLCHNQEKCSPMDLIQGLLAEMSCC